MAAKLKVIERERMFAAAMPGFRFNAEAAAIAIGIPPSGAKVQANRLLKKVSVQKMIGEHVAKALEKATRDIPAIINELEAIGFSNMAKFTRLEGGRRYIDFSETTEDEMRAVAEIITEDIEVGSEDEEDGEPVSVRRVKTRLKLHDKKSALVDLLRYHTVGGKGLGVGDGGTQIFNLTQNVQNNISVEHKADVYRAAIEGE